MSMILINKLINIYIFRKPNQNMVLEFIANKSRGGSAAYKYERANNYD